MIPDESFLSLSSETRPSYFYGSETPTYLEGSDSYLSSGRTDLTSFPLFTNFQYTTHPPQRRSNGFYTEYFLGTTLLPVVSRRVGVGSVLELHSTTKSREKEIRVVMVGPRTFSVFSLLHLSLILTVSWGGRVDVLGLEVGYSD